MYGISHGEFVSIDPSKLSGMVRLDRGGNVFSRWRARRSIGLVDGSLVFGSQSSHVQVPTPKVGDRIVCVLGEDSLDRVRIERYALESDWKQAVGATTTYRIIQQTAPGIGSSGVETVLWCGDYPQQAPLEVGQSTLRVGSAATYYRWEEMTIGGWVRTTDPRIRQGS